MPYPKIILVRFLEENVTFKSRSDYRRLLARDTPRLGPSIRNGK